MYMPMLISLHSQRLWCEDYVENRQKPTFWAKANEWIIDQKLPTFVVLIN